MSVPVCLLENVYGEAKCQKDAWNRTNEELTGVWGVAQG